MPTAATKARVLIIDDDPLVRDLLVRILSGVGGYATELAADGLDGLEKLEGTDYDVVFTDLTMPRLNGMEFLRTSKRVRPSVPVVVITGTSAMEVAVRAMREGASDFITKPFRVDKILATTERIIGEQRLLGRLAAAPGPGVSLDGLNAELFRRLQAIVALHSISTEIDAQYDNKEIFARIAEMGAKLLPVQEAAFGIVDDGVLAIKSAIGPQGGAACPVTGTFMEDILARGEHRVADVGEDHPLTRVPLASQLLAIPLVVGSDAFGLLCLSGKADGSAFSEEEIYLAVNFAKKAAAKIENNALYDVFYHNLVDTLRSLIATIEARDSYTKQHSERVTMCALQIAEAMGLPPEEADAIRFAGYLHDIGKIGVRDTVLLKPGGLTRDEFEEIRRHSAIGDEIIKPIKFLTKEREIIRHHHEHYDGRGYPDGIAGEAIPLIARIFGVADSYDAMTSNRPYRRARPHADAMSEVARCGGTQFDPAVVQAFFSTATGRGLGRS